MTVSQFPAAVTEDWDSWIRDFDSFASNWESVRNVLSKDNVDGVVRETDVVSVHWVSKTMIEGIRTKKPLVRYDFNMR
jgi:hypothetical protein